jgi:hypothetical protein
MAVADRHQATLIVSTLTVRCASHQHFDCTACNTPASTKQFLPHTTQTTTVHLQVVLFSITGVGAFTKPLLGMLLRDGGERDLAAQLSHVPLLGWVLGAGWCRMGWMGWMGLVG